MNIKYRCGRTGCRAIHHLSKPPDHYKITKKCHCGGTLYDYSGDRKRNKARTCNCGGIHHPHHKATSVWCNHHIAGPTDSDYRARYGY